jgi:hypothetical protein
MPLALCLIHLRFPENGSLKEKRQVLRSIVERVRSRFNVSIAEIGDNDNWRAASLAVSCVSNDGAHAHTLLTKVVEFIQGARLDAELVDYEIELVRPL